MTMPPPGNAPGLQPPPPPPSGRPGQPVLPPPPAGASKSRWPVWAAAGVVLLLVGGGAATWAVLANEDDGSDGDGSENAPTPLVTGDLDENGFGDLLVLQKRGDTKRPTRTWTQLSSGTAFGEPVDGEIGTGDTLSLGDVDGDGLVDQVWSPIGATDTITVEVVPADGEPWTQDFPVDPVLYGDFPGVSLADLSGDGRADLVIINESADGLIGVHVAVAEDDGFAEPEQWYGADGETQFFDVYPGDGDGDGITDLIALTHWSGPKDDDAWFHELQLLTSDGSTLTAAADPVPVRAIGIVRGLQGVGDIDGDGDDDPFLATKKGLYTVDLTEGGDVEDQMVYTHSIATEVWVGSIKDYLYSNEFWGVSDADGDGTDDVVHLRPDGEGAVLDVFSGGEDGLAEPEDWGRFPCEGDACADSYTIIPVSP